MEESWRRTTSSNGGGFIQRRHSTDDHRIRSSSRRSNINRHIQCSSDIDDDNDPRDIHHMQAAVPDQLDFSDVFGGPPRSSANILLRRHFAGSTSSSTRNFYDEIFCPATLRPTSNFPQPRMRPRTSSSSSNSSRTIRIGRKLPGFSIPSSSSSSVSAAGIMEEGFYDDIFGCSSGSGGTRKTSKSKSSSSSKSNYSRSKSKAPYSGSSTTSVLSSEDTILIPSNIDNMINVMPPPPSASDHRLCHHRHHREKVADEQEDAILSSFASKLRPITIPTRSRARGYEYVSSPPSTRADQDAVESSSQRSLITIHPLSTSFMDLSSSSSVPPLPTPSLDVKRIFSFNSNSIRPMLATNAAQAQADRMVTDKKQVVVVQDDGGEINGAGDESENDSVIQSESSFVIKEIENGIWGETEGAAAVDEAIAWAKAKFWNGRPPAGV